MLSMKSGKRVWVYLLSFQICKTYLNAIGNVAGERGAVTNVPFQRGGQGRIDWLGRGGGTCLPVHGKGV